MDPPVPVPDAHVLAIAQAEIFRLRELVVSSRNKIRRLRAERDEARDWITYLYAQVHDIERAVKEAIPSYSDSDDDDEIENEPDEQAANGEIVGGGNLAAPEGAEVAEENSAEEYAEEFDPMMVESAAPAPPSS